MRHAGFMTSLPIWKNVVYFNDFIHEESIIQCFYDSVIYQPLIFSIQQL